ncbi:GIY-YIG nuclease family protein [Patescibacteria group bacterium]|nr:GIY-YIG nuclease family protein [Patescibacteria group bacterium]MBU1890363.1 GIY-YIG nuclease family protein [Patescibacteria group bacterium]
MTWHFVYILRSIKDGKFYIGYTRNIERRVSQHNRGENISTSKRRPFELIYFEAHRSKFDTLRRERYFKTNKGKTTLKYILREDLSIAK